MNQVGQSSRILHTHGRADVVGRALLIAVVIVAIASAAILASSRIAGSASQSSAGPQVDPLRLPELIEFRAGERVMGESR